MVTTTRKRSDGTSRKKSLNKPPVPAAQPQSANGNGASSSPSDAEVLRQLYYAVLKYRMMAEYAQDLLPAGKYDFAIGHEAVVAGTTFGLRTEDTIAASKRNFAALLAGQIPLQHLLLQQDARNCCSHGLGGVVAPASLPSDPFNIGTGIALAHKIEQKQNVVVALCAEQSPALDRWHDALQVAGTQKLPIAYIIECGAVNASSASPQNAHLEDFSYIARDCGFPGIVVDGGDVVAVWRVAQESLHRARNGSGPTLIDCRMDSSPDPLAHMEHYMRKRNAWDDAWKKQISQQIRAEMQAAV